MSKNQVFHIFLTLKFWELICQILMSRALTSHIVTLSISHIYEDNINTSIIDFQQYIAQNFWLTCTMQSLINHTPLFMLQFENTKLWATCNPPVISGLPNKILGLNREDKY